MLVAPAARLFAWLDQVGNANAKGEYYLTEVVTIANAEGAAVRACYGPERAMRPADTQGQIAACEAMFQADMRARLMAEGVAMMAPETVYFSYDTLIAGGATVEPFVVFARGVTVEAGAVIRAFSHLESCIVGAGALIGPYARLRPGAEIGPEAHIGNFVEVKKVKVGRGVRPTTWPIWATAASAPGPTSAPGPSSVTMTASTNSTPMWAKGRLSAPIPRSWRRSGSATAPIPHRVR